MTVVLIMGSGPNVLEARLWDRGHINHILAINNAYAVRPDWDSLIYPDDFPDERRPLHTTLVQKIITSEEYVPAQNRHGGFVYAGATMAFTAGYWALDHHSPKVIAFIGCDMMYPDGKATHFYGKGSADPLRDDITLQSLEAKSARLMVQAAVQGCAVVNLSQGASRLAFPRANRKSLNKCKPNHFSAKAVKAATDLENDLAYRTPTGRYWENIDQFDPVKLQQLDALWSAAALAPSAAIRDT